MKAKKFVLKQQFVGFPKYSDVEIMEEELPPVTDGEFLAEAVFISIDPFIRIHPQEVGNVVMGQQVARILESKSEHYAVGNYIVGFFGWRTHTISTPQLITPDHRLPEYLIKDMDDLPLSLPLGILGMPGNTAYFGFLDICKPKEGETVVVSGAAGTVGSHVGQIAKIKGCKVIGIVGSESKGKWITEELGFNYYINYKNQNLKEELIKCAPEGIDCYFDNIGGDMSSTIISTMKRFGRISVCGFISQYNLESGFDKAPALQGYFVSNCLQMQGYSALLFVPRWHEGIAQNLKWIKEKKLKYRETIIEGFENTFQAFLDLLSGKNIGKTIVKV